jgi:hypothetical protein
MATSNPSSDAAAAASAGRPLTRTAYQLVAMASTSVRSVYPLPGCQDITIVPGQRVVTISTV